MSLAKNGKKLELLCNYCRKVFYRYKENKYCSLSCMNKSKINKEELAFEDHGWKYEELDKYITLQHKKEKVRVLSDSIIAVTYLTKFKKITLQTYFTLITLYCKDQNEFYVNLEILKNNNYEMIKEQ